MWKNPKIKLSHWEKESKNYTLADKLGEDSNVEAVDKVEKTQ
jgi:hypothetical protein